jgi:hypothetical protein
MAEIFTEIIIIKKYKFCDEIWDMIKDYIGLHGINLELPNIIKNINNAELYKYNIRAFGHNLCNKKGPQRKSFYNNLRLKNKEDKNIICNSLIESYEESKFKIPEDLKIGETILIYVDNLFERDRDIGIVSSINKNSFTVKVPEKTYSSYSGKYTYYDRIRIVKKNKYLRREKATEHELRYFIKGN